jgi:hypothetical protein
MRTLAFAQATASSKDAHVAGSLTLAFSPVRGLIGVLLGLPSSLGVRSQQTHLRW